MENIKNFIIEGEKELDNFQFAVGYKQNGQEIVDFDYHKEEREKLKQFISSRQISLIKMIVEMCNQDLEEQLNSHWLYLVKPEQAYKQALDTITSKLSSLVNGEK